ncbi:hypothetical protein LJK88_17200 [Paenibacillus sp. P26]|nr:hypothetical protein LJK88_17200 [Paenibacillus sp. P26]UUZ96487.1 hypothetical protein LJK87_20580 [Paenibacillus sp. P25]
MSGKKLSLFLLLGFGATALAGCRNEPATSDPSPQTDQVSESADNELFIFTGDQLFNKRYTREENFDRLIVYPQEVSGYQDQACAVG